MKLNDGIPKSRKRIAVILEISVKTLDRFCDKHNLKFKKGLVMPYDQERIDRIMNGQEFDSADDKPPNDG